jgi:hypothetical protein
MSQIHCLIQADGAAAGHEAELEERLRTNHAAHFPGGDVEVAFRAVEAGRMFTAGSAGTSAVIGCTIDRATTGSEREAYRRGVCDLWTEVTGCTEHEIVVSVSDPDDFSDE